MLRSDRNTITVDSSAPAMRGGRWVSRLREVALSAWFTPPVVVEGWHTGEYLTTLFSRQDRGVALLRTGSTYVEKRYPSETELAAADAYFLGGRRHLVSDAEAALLTAAGYESGLDGYVPDPEVPTDGSYTATYSATY